MPRMAVDDNQQVSLRMLDLLENPPPPNVRLLATSCNLPPLHRGHDYMGRVNNQVHHPSPVR